MLLLNLAHKFNKIKATVFNNNVHYLAASEALWDKQNRLPT